MRPLPCLPAVLMFAALLLIPACSQPQAPDAQSPAAVAAAASAPAEVAAIPALGACQMVTAREMSAILGSEMKAEGEPGTAYKTECTYMPASGISPYAILTVARGDAEAAMSAMAIVGKMEDGLANPYAGIGDQAFAVGPMLNIRHGQDLVQITLSGVDDVPAAARKVFDTAKPRL